MFHKNGDPVENRVIVVKTLVLGGGQEKALGGEAFRQIVAAIDGADLKMYHKWGSAVNRSVREFLDR